MSDRRRLLEVLKWVSLADVLSTTSLVSQLWLDASENDEVWVNLCADYSISPYRSEDLTFKESFFLRLFGLPVLSETSLTVANCLSMTVMKECTLSERLDNRFQYTSVLLYNGGLIACRKQEAYYISPSGALQKLQPLLFSRIDPSVTTLHEAVYTFCGVSIHPNSAEKLQLEPLEAIAERERRVLPPSLVPHAHCQPCVQSALIYLCGGITERSEVFNTVSEEYSLLPFTLPECSSECVSFFRNGELTVFTQKYVSRWRPGNILLVEQSSDMGSLIRDGTKKMLLGNRLFSVVNGEIKVVEIEKRRRRSVSLLAAH